MLVGVIGLILAGYGWWFLAPRKSSVTLEIEIRPWTLSIEPGGTRLPPHYRPDKGDWLVAGRPMRSIAGLAIDDNPDIGKYVFISLPGGDRAAMQQALAGLAADGICQAAIQGDGVYRVAVIRIVRIADSNGQLRACRDRFAAPH